MNQNEQANKEILYRSEFSPAHHIKGVIISGICSVVTGVILAAAIILIQETGSLRSTAAFPIFLFGGAFGSLIVDLVAWLFYSLFHKDVFYTEDGVYIGKEPYGKTFLAWDQVEEIKGDGVSKNGKYGHMLILAKMPDPKNPEETRMVRYFVVYLKTPDDVAEAGMKFVRAAKSKAADTQQQPVPDESTEG